MSALDQAIIKAYAKDRPTAAPVSAVNGNLQPLSPAVGKARAHAIEQLYHDGSLYRVEAHAPALQATRRIPTPHLAALPPTSPRRGVRRSVLRMLAAHTEAATPESVLESPRVARKVIIRHISHAVAPPPLGMLRSSPPAHGSDRAELLPETISDDPSPALPMNPPPSAPQVAPLNIALENIPAIQVRADWDHEAAMAPMVLVSNVKSQDAHSTLVNVQLDALTSAAEAAQAWNLRYPDELANDTNTAHFAAKSLDDREEPRIEIRVDAPHAHGRHGPHARFAAVHEDETTTTTPSDDANDIAAISVTEEETPIEAQAAEELTFAESLAEPLASDLIPPGDDAPPDSITDGIQARPVGEIKPALPLWEVDRFHWPRTCEKLFADEHGYLSLAGDKLLAAVQDGLRVLAITGSRRGEGRTTLALCLARAAARAGIQAAVMDADFARPQLASKIALEIAFGWQDAALGQIPLSEAAVKSLADNITLLPLESSAATRSLSLADPRVTATIRAAAATFELLILDLGPLSAGEGMDFPLGEGCPFDAAIVVRDLRFATALESEAVGNALHDAGVEAVGIAENYVIEDEIPATSV